MCLNFVGWNKQNILTPKISIITVYTVVIIKHFDLYTSVSCICHFVNPLTIHSFLVCVVLPIAAFG